MSFSDVSHWRLELVETMSCSIFQQFVALPWQYNSPLLFVSFAVGSSLSIVHFEIECALARYFRIELGVHSWELGAKVPVAMATKKKVTSGPGFEASALNRLHAWVQEPATGLGIPLQTKAGSSLKKFSFVKASSLDKNFNPATQKSTNAQIWVRFYNLSWEFWHPHILMDLARGIGAPLKFDHSTIAKMGINVRSIASDLGAAHNRTDFNIVIGKSVQITLETVQTSSYHSTVPHQVTSWTYAFGDSNDEPGDDLDDIVEDEWPPLQGETLQNLHMISMVPQMWVSIQILWPWFRSIRPVQHSKTWWLLCIRQFRKLLIRIYGI
ncbi:hypothetical protein FNV43_RR02106 [Rhamnella rubrinervis]|uniref:DUF4283 domain-containing protein n=1 Tax=Rhamnella rubrinervis TaxID=2594499 RepID=A0A8K0MTJ4_9ROSA|nr:hypothetical protein FNV43_RR02106 [Rhamnella rubrinervis]